MEGKTKKYTKQRRIEKKIVMDWLRTEKGLTLNLKLSTDRL